jgi:hypothetical protein
MDENLNISLDITAAPVTIDCGCETCSTGFESTESGVIGPVAPVFLPPTVAIVHITAPAGAVSSTLSYQIVFNQNNGGAMTSIQAFIGSTLVHTGTTLTDSFDVLLSPGTHTLRIAVSHEAGVDAYNSDGTLINNPIDAGSVSIIQDIVVVPAKFVGTALNTGAIPNALDTITWQSGLTALLYTGTVDKCFWIAILSSTTLLRAEDVDTAHINLLGLFTFVKNITLNGSTFKILAMTNAIPYVNTHKFEFDA